MSGKTEEERRAPITLAVVWKDKNAPKKKRKSPVHTEDFLRKSSERMRAMWESPECQAKRIANSKAAMQKKRSDPEFREKELKRLRSYEQQRLARVRLAIAEKMKDPDYVASLREGAKKKWEDGTFSNANQTRTPQGIANNRASIRRSHDRRRGFAIPKHLRKQYDHLVKIKRFKAHEAGIILGIIKVAPKQSIMTLKEYQVPKGEIGSVLEAVSRVTGVKCEDIMSPSRVTEFVRARMVFYYVAKTYCRHSFPKIGAAIGRHHVTVLSGCEKVRKNTDVYSATIRRVLDMLSREDKLAA